MDSSPIPRVLVVGATGTTGRHLLELLDGRAHVVPASRSAHRSLASGVHLDWSDPRTHEAPLDGVDAVYVVPPVAVADPAGTLLAFLALAGRRGVRRVVLHGAHSIASSDPGLGEVQRALPSLASEWAALRPSWFMQNLLGEHALARGLRDAGVLRTATEEGRLPFVDVADLAAVGVVALLGEPLDREVVVTGPESLSYADVADVLGEETGRAVRHERMDEDALARSLTPELGDEFARLLAHMDRRIAAGAWQEPTDEVHLLTGRPATTLRAFVRRHRAELGGVDR